MDEEVRLIDANKLLEDIEDAIDIENDGEDVEKSKFIIFGLILAKKYINKAATIEAQPVKHGRWVMSPIQKHVEITYECSECRYEAVGDYEKTPFCGGCGARMDDDK